MNIPGANLLSIAARVIQFQTLGWRAFVSRSVNSTGDQISLFALSVDIQASFQPVDKKLYQDLGLNFSKNYAKVYTSAPVLPTTRDREGDKLTFGGRTWQCESDQNWSVVDGFTKMLVVEIPS